MPHTLTAVQFNPAASAYWLPRSGQRTAAKIPTTQFWAIRFHIDDSEEGDTCPKWLCVVSPEPSPLPLPNASMTLGPKRSRVSSVIHAGHEDLTLGVALPCTNDETVHLPMYVHTAPVVKIHMFCSPPVKRVLCQFEGESLRRFKRTVRDNDAALREHWISRQSIQWVRRIAHWNHHGLPDPTFSEQAIDPTYMWSYLNNPRAYCFDFIYDGLVNAIEKRPRIHEEILLYAQICRDYRWKGVERTLLWIRASRTNGNNPQREAEPLVEDHDSQDATKLFRSDPAVRQIAKELLTFDIHSLDVEEEEREAATSSDSSTGSGDLGYTLVYHRDFAFPQLAWKYPEIPLGTPRILVFDTFGVVLNREEAIRRVLASWLPLTHRVQTFDDILALYMEIEALTARSAESLATSMAAIVHSALRILANKLGILSQADFALAADAVAEIVKPRPYHDVEPALEALSRQGLPVIVIPPHSEVAIEHLVSSLPCNKVLAANEPLSIHFAATNSFFKSLLKQCRSIVPHIEPKDVLFVSAGVGRVIAPASLAGHPTALLERHGTIASKVRFVVGHLPHTNPVPSLVVEDLTKLLHKVCQPAGRIDQ
ncbi:hypothetical protein GY45DRAFT_1332459 [Cubamyces sp. BRFM 1775]|nr:hypothetical protein GY45DRAFT_1332459 [Cubamyces sp. BRFM 1775]